MSNYISIKTTCLNPAKKFHSLILAEKWQSYNEKNASCPIFKKKNCSINGIVHGIKNK